MKKPKVNGSPPKFIAQIINSIVSVGLNLLFIPISLESCDLFILINEPTQKNVAALNKPCKNK
jgi:hypothetical protein